MLFNKTRDKKDEGDFSDRRDNNKQVVIHQLVCLKSKLESQRTAKSKAKN